MPTPPTPPSNSNGGSTTTPNKKKPPSRLWSSGSSPKNSPQSSPKTSPQNSKSKLVGKSTKSNNRSSDRDLTNMDASTNSNFSRSTSNSTSLGGTNTNTNDEPVVKAKRSSMGHGSKFTQGVTKMVQAPFKAGMYAGQKVVEAGTRTSTAVVQAGTAVGTTVGNTVTKGGKAMVDAGTAVGTTVGNTVIFGANTIVGGGKAIVEGTGAVVEYSGKTVVKGVKGLVTVPLSLAKRGTKAKSKWDQGVDTIDSLLEPSSDTYQAMTPEQRKALQNVKKLLLRGPSEQDKIAHIPRDLLKEGNKEMKEIRRRNTTSTGGAKTIANRRASTNFILQEYAGVRSAAIAADDLTESEGDGSDALDSSENSEPIIGENEDLDSMRRPSIQISLSVDDMDIYHTPSEFKALSLEDQKKMCTLLAWENLARWDFNIFELDLLSQGNPLLYMGWAILGAPHAQMAMAGECEMTSPPDDAGFNFLTEFSIPPRKLCNYLRIIQKDYHAENPYHNAIHAADVVQSLNALLHMILGQGSLSYCPPIMIFSILLSAVVHDVDHPGKTNAFHTKLRTELAVMYNDTSVLENWHVAHAFARMLNMDLLDTKEKDITMAREIIAAKLNQQNCRSEFNLLCNVTPEVFNNIRNYMIEAVLHTDMTKHFSMVSAAKGMLLDDEITVEDRAWKLLMFMLHMADISGQAKPAPMFLLWTQRCMAEFFSQGDQEAALGLPISPNCDRDSVSTAESQMGFIKFVVAPAYSVLGEYIPAVQDRVLPLIQHNLDHWANEKEELDSKSAEC